MPETEQKFGTDLEAIKRLLILQLLESGTPQSRIAAILGISPATMSRMMPKGLSKSIKGSRKQELRDVEP